MLVCLKRQLIIILYSCYYVYKLKTQPTVNYDNSYNESVKIMSEEVVLSHCMTDKRNHIVSNCSDERVDDQTST